MREREGKPRVPRSEWQPKEENLSECSIGFMYQPERCHLTTTIMLVGEWVKHESVHPTTTTLNCSDPRLCSRKVAGDFLFFLLMRLGL